MDIMAQSIPNRFLPPRRNLPWLTKPIIQSMRKRNMLFKKAKSSGNFTKYKRAHNRTTNLLKLAKKRYFHSLNPKDSKKFWRAVKSLNKSKQFIPTLSHDGEVACDDADKANLLCSFFSSCFNQSRAPISPSPNHPLAFHFLMNCCVLNLRCSTSWPLLIQQLLTVKMVSLLGCLNQLLPVSLPL